MINFFEMIADATVLLSLVLSLAIIFKYHSLSQSLKIAGLYLIVSSSIDVAATAFYNIRESNLVFLHLFTFFEIVIISLLFKIVFESLNSKFNILYVAIPGVLLVILNTIFLQSILEFNTYASILTSIIIIGYSIHFFILILDFKAPSYQFGILKWFIICMFIFHSISLVFMLFVSLLPDISREAQSYIWSFRSLVLLSTKIILIVSFSQLFYNKNMITNE